MKTTSSICLKSAFAVICTLCASCSLTGDPTQGGIFWSQTKAMERRQELLNQQVAKQDEYNRLTRATSSYGNTRNRLQKENRTLKSEQKKTETLKGKDAVNAAIKDIEAELEN